MPRTPRTLFGKPPLSVSSPLSSFGMEDACRMGKRIRACPPPPHTAPAGLCLSWASQPLPAPKSTPKSTPKQTVADYFCDAKCPACGSEDLKERKGKVKYATVTEFLTLLWIPVLAVVAGLAGTVLASFLLPFDVMWTFSGLITIGCVVAGGVWGSVISRKAVKRSRLRHGISSTSYRCNRCQKVFDHKKALEN